MNLVVPWLTNLKTVVILKFSNSLIGGGAGKGRRIGNGIEGNLGYTFTPLAAPEKEIYIRPRMS